MDREVQGKIILFAKDPQYPASRFKGDLRSVSAATLKKRMGRCQGSVTAKFDRISWSEPTEPIDPFFIHEECRLSQIIFLRYGLQRFIGKPVVHGANRLGIALERLISKGINLVNEDFQLFTRQAVSTTLPSQTRTDAAS